MPPTQERNRQPKHPNPPFLNRLHHFELQLLPPRHLRIYSLQQLPYLNKLPRSFYFSHLWSRKTLQLCHSWLQKSRLPHRHPMEAHLSSIELWPLKFSGKNMSISIVLILYELHTCFQNAKMSFHILSSNECLEEFLDVSGTQMNNATRRSNKALVLCSNAGWCLYVSKSSTATFPSSKRGCMAG